MNICICLLWISLNTYDQLIHAYKKVSLNSMIHHYESLNYDLEKVNHRRKRALDNDYTLRLRMHTHDRTLRLLIKPDRSVLSDDFRSIDEFGKEQPHDVSFIYAGHLLGEPDSAVYGSVLENVFTGVIHPHANNSESYHVELASLYAEDLAKLNDTGHSIVYHTDNVNASAYGKKKKSEEKLVKRSCGYHGKVEEEMKRVERSTYEANMRQQDLHGKAKYLKEDSLAVDDSPETIELERGEGEETRGGDQHMAKSRRKRYSNKKPMDLTCTLYIQTDPIIWEYIVTVLKFNPAQARNYLTNLIILIVKGSNFIFMKTHFYNSTIGSYSPVNLIVRRIRINESCVGRRPHVFCNNFLDSSRVLHYNTLFNHDDYCLAYVITARDFAEGVLGLAWIGGQHSSAGVCSRYSTVDNEGKSLNTGIVTVINYGNLNLQYITMLTLAHEIGHNFGSPHDNPDDNGCSINNRESTAEQEKENGYFLMYPRARVSDNINSQIMSPCSIEYITKNLHAIYNEIGIKKNCFVASSTSFCGNQVTEEGEECDCGYSNEDCKEGCCFPRSDAEGRGCTLKADMECSPSQGACCESNCNFKGNHILCMNETECTKKIYCPSDNAECQLNYSNFKENGTSCHKNTKICISGKCKSSICKKINWNDCFMTTDKKNPTMEERENMCYLACQNPNTKICISTNNKLLMSRKENSKFKDLLVQLDLPFIRMLPGSPCNNYIGYCDTLYKCRTTDDQGPLARIKRLLFNKKSVENIRKWVIEHYFRVLLMCIGLVVLMGVFIHIFAIHTPSSNPYRKPARKLHRPKFIKRHMTD